MSRLLERRMAMTKKENNSFAYLKFKQLCSEKNMTPYQVSVQSDGASSTTVLTQWKNGEYELKLDKLKIIANVFKQPVTVFIE